MYSTKYILSYSNELNEFYEIYFDYLGYIGTSSVILSAVNGLILRSIAGDEDRFNAICGTECLINVFVGKQGLVDDSALTIFDLIAQQDNQIRITVYKDYNYTRSIFQGFVVVEDNSQPYLDPPFTLSIRALDGLGLLKGVDMVDQNGQPFVGALAPIVWIANILYKTGQTLNIRGFFNIVNTATLGFEPLQAFTIPASTFKTGQPTTTTDTTIDLNASAADDCYTALEKIVRCLRCRLFQQEGVWNLVNIWEYQNPNGASCREYTISAPDPTSGLCSAITAAVAINQNYDIAVGQNQLIHPVKDDAVLSLKLATKSEKLTYKYDQSDNKVCNQDFQQGNPDVAHNGTISSAVQDPSIIPTVVLNFNAYFPFCWNIFGGTAGVGGTAPFPETSATGYQYIRDVLDIYENSIIKYLVIQSISPVVHARSSTFLVDAGDLLTVSFDFRTYSDIGPVALAPLVICLTGIDGSHWVLGELGSTDVLGIRWIAVDANFQYVGGITPAISHNYISGEPTTGWTTYTADKNILGGLNQVPISGNVFIILEALPSATESWFKNVSITITPFLQGSYLKLSGDYNYASSNQLIKQTFLEDIEISDSPKRYFKGALLQTDGQTLMPTSWILNGISGQVPNRFTKLMITRMYNALYRQFQKIEGTFKGLIWNDLAYTVRQVGMLNRYYFPDHPVPTKKFMLTSFEIDLTTGFGRRVFIEILNDQNDNGQIAPDVPIFQYQFGQ